MDVGTENRKKVIGAAGLCVVALLLVGRWLFSSPAGAAATPAQAAAPAAPGHPLPGATKGTLLLSSIDPTLREDWLKAGEGTKYEGRGRNIFRAEAEPMPTPTASARLPQQPPPPPVDTGPPPPPPINLRFYGFASQSGEPKKVFLSEGDDIFVAGEGDIIDRRYKILRIMPTAVEIEDVLNNNRQQIPLTQG